MRPRMGLLTAIMLSVGVGTITYHTRNLSAYSATQELSQKQPQSQASSKSPISVWVTVLDKQGQPVADLKQEDFRVLEDGKEQTLTSTAFGIRQPLAVGFLMQWSGMRASTLPYGEIEPAVEFFHSLMGKEDFSFVAKFTNTVEPLGDFTNDPSDIERALRYAEAKSPGGGSALYDSIIWACSEKLSTRPQRRVLLLVADGHDNESKKPLREAIESALRSEIAIYVVGLSHAEALTGQQSEGLFPPSNARQKSNAYVVKDLAEQTGGDAIFVRKQEDLAPAFQTVHHQLGNQYLIGYSSASQTRRGEFRKIKIEVKSKGLHVLARSGYYVSP